MEFESVRLGNKIITHDSGAKRELKTRKGRYDLLPVHAIHRIARHFENGAVVYGDENWRKGLPLRQFIDSALRHTFKLLDGSKDEDHAAAAAWNILCFIETQKMIEDGELPETLDNWSSVKGSRTRHEMSDSMGVYL